VILIIVGDKSFNLSKEILTFYSNFSQPLLISFQTFYPLKSFCSTYLRVFRNIIAKGTKDIDVKIKIC